MRNISSIHNIPRIVFNLNFHIEMSGIENFQYQDLRLLSFTFKRAENHNINKLHFHKNQNYNLDVP